MHRLEHYMEGLPLEIRRAITLRHADKEKMENNAEKFLQGKKEVEGIYVHSS